MADETQKHDKDDGLDAFIVEMQDLDATEERKIFFNLAPARSELSPQSTRISLKSHITTRQRRLRILITIGLVFITVITLLASNTSVRALITSRFLSSSSTPAATTYPWMKAFYIDANPAWGTLFVDGHRLKQIPIPGENPPVQLSPGQHTIIWSAIPFEPRQCSFSVPTDFQPDPRKCLLTVKSFNVPGSPNSHIIASVIEFYPSLYNLSTNQRSLLIKAAQDALDTKSATTLLQKGEFYISGEAGKLIAAQEPLHASIHLVLDTNSNHPCVGLSSGGGCISPAVSCFFFCDANYFPGFGLPPGFSQSSNDWYAFVVTRATWDYITLDGRTVASSQPDAAIPLLQDANNSIGFGYMTLLHFTWNGKQWQASLVTPAFPQLDIPAFTNSPSAGTGFSMNPTCTTTWDELNRDGLYRVVGQVNQLANWRFISGSDTSQGCLAIDTASNAYFWHRFGVTMAANDQAHALETALPRVNNDATSQSIIHYLASLEIR